MASLMGVNFPFMKITLADIPVLTYWVFNFLPSRSAAGTVRGSRRERERAKLHKLGAQPRGGKRRDERPWR
jgi:hypothetical protein